MQNTPTNDDDEFGEDHPPVTAPDAGDPMPILGTSVRAVGTPLRLCPRCGVQHGLTGQCQKCGSMLMVAA